MALVLFKPKLTQDCYECIDVHGQCKTTATENALFVYY